MPDVELKRIDLSETDDIETAIQECVDQGDQHGCSENGNYAIRVWQGVR